MTDTTEYQPKRRAIVFFPDPILMMASLPIVEADDYVHKLAMDLIATAEACQAEGIAAVQVGEPLRLIIVRTPNGYLAMVNPQFRPHGFTKTLMNEGCLSFPGAVERVERFNEVEVAYTTLLGTVETAVMKLDEGGHAVQHEVEHLDGVTLIQKLPPHRRDKMRTHMKKVTRLAARIEKAVKVDPTSTVFGYAPEKAA